MRRFGSVLILAVASATLIYAGKRFPLTASSIVPAAKGCVEIGKDRNGNTELRLEVEHLVWVQEKAGVPTNRGELRVNGKLEGAFQIVTPDKNFDLFITGENDGTVKSPSGPEVMRSTISR